ncbi:MAG: integrase, partial [Gammaproteobacteria bacterium]
SGRKDITKDPAVVLALKRMHRKNGRAQRQAIPLTANLLEELLAVCDPGTRGQRDEVLLRLGYETMRRRSELCRFKFSDIVVLPNGKTGIKLNFSKTDQFGKGKLIPISTQLYQAIETWGDTAGRSNYILKSVTKNGEVGPSLNPGSIGRLLQDLQLQAGLKLGGRLTGHSFRVGAALDLLDRGETLEKIMLRGGWHAESTVVRYLREWQAL